MARPSKVPPTIDSAAISQVSRRPASMNGRFFAMTSSIAETLHALLARAGYQQQAVARDRHEREIEQRNRDVDFKRPERLPFDRRGLIGELGDGDDRGERGVLDQ